MVKIIASDIGALLGKNKFKTQLQTVDYIWKLQSQAFEDWCTSVNFPYASIHNYTKNMNVFDTILQNHLCLNSTLNSNSNSNSNLHSNSHSNKKVTTELLLFGAREQKQSAVTIATKFKTGDEAHKRNVIKEFSRVILPTPATPTPATPTPTPATPTPATPTPTPATPTPATPTPATPTPATPTPATPTPTPTPTPPTVSINQAKSKIYSSIQQCMEKQAQCNLGCIMEKSALQLYKQQLHPNEKMLLRNDIVQKSVAKNVILCGKIDAYVENGADPRVVEVKTRIKCLYGRAWPQERCQIEVYMRLFETMSCDFIEYMNGKIECRRYIKDDVLWQEMLQDLICVDNILEQMNNWSTSEAEIWIRGNEIVKENIWEQLKLNFVN